MEKPPKLSSCLVVVSLAMASTLVGCKSDNAVGTPGDGSLPPAPDASSKKDSPTDTPWAPGPDTSSPQDTPAEMPSDPGPDTSLKADAPTDLIWTWDPDLRKWLDSSSSPAPTAVSPQSTVARSPVVDDLGATPPRASITK